MSNRAITIVSLVFFAIIAVSLGSYFAWQRLQNQIANDPQTHFNEAESAIARNDPIALMGIIARHPHVVHDRLTYDQGTLLHYAMTNTPNLACATILIAEGADVNATDYVGRTPLHYVCRYNGGLPAVQFLVSHAADVNAQSGIGETPLSSLFGYNSKQVRIYLIEEGAIEQHPSDDEEP